MIKNRFIVLIDFSSYSTALLEFAHKWGKAVNAEFLLINQTVVAAPALAEPDIKREVARISKKEALDKLRELAREVLSKKATVKYLVFEENLISVLPGLLQERFNNLVFLGLKSTGILKRVLVGSVATDVIDNIHNLTVLLPKSSHDFSCESVLVAVQRKYPLNTAEFDKFLELTNKKVKRITFFSVVGKSREEYEATEKYLKRLKDQYSGHSSTFYEIHKGNVVLESLKAVVTQKGNQFLVVQRGSRAFFDQIFRTFLIHELAYEGETPMIVVP